MAQRSRAAMPHLTAHLGKLAPTDDVAVALNTAFMGDGAVIDVAEGAALARPIHLVFVNAGKEPASMFVRSLAVIENGARAMLVESHVGSNAGEDQVNAALELKVGDAAHVDHVKITGQGAGALHVSSLMATIGAHARFNEFLFTTGAAVVRNQMFVRFAGQGTVAGIRGASLLRGRQHADTTLVADHAVAGCTSREVFKSVLDDESRSVFQGKIIVRPARAKDRRQDGDARAAAVGHRGGRQQARARDLRRRRAVRPWRDHRRARRGSVVLSAGRAVFRPRRPRRC